MLDTGQDIVPMDVLWGTTLSCALHVHAYKRIDPAYANTRARQIFVTLGMESNWTWARQDTVANPAGMVGGNGVAQVEWVSVKDSLRRLDGKPLIRRRLAEWLFPSESFYAPMAEYWYQSATADGVVWMMRRDHRTAIAFCSLHYQWQPGLIPTTAKEMFLYWLEKYNMRGVLKHHTEEETLARWMSKFQRALRWMDKRVA